MRALLRAAPLLVLVCLPLHAQTPLPRINANDNRVPAGVLKDGVLTLQLEVTRGMWHPDRDTDPGTDMLAFAEVGKAPSIPGPLIRVPVGTEVRTTVRNMLADSSILLFGLSGTRTRADTVRLQPGETRELRTRVSEPGTFL
jgi:manganese oxidase